MEKKKLSNKLLKRENSRKFSPTSLTLILGLSLAGCSVYGKSYDFPLEDQTCRIVNKVSVSSMFTCTNFNTSRPEYKIFCRAKNETSDWDESQYVLTEDLGNTGGVDYLDFSTVPKGSSLEKLSIGKINKLLVELKRGPKYSSD